MSGFLRASHQWIVCETVGPETVVVIFEHAEALPHVSWSMEHFFIVPKDPVLASPYLGLGRHTCTQYEIGSARPIFQPALTSPNGKYDLCLQ